jgi:predicted adenylyl cyclase CyaB
MPVNVEIKSRVWDPARIKFLVESFARTSGEQIEQEDVFFVVPRGRLKLRILSATSAELIYYEREDGAGPKESSYVLSRSSEPESLRNVLSESLGVRGVVREKRTLYQIGQTRIHLDEVEGLGSFAELEVVMNEGQSQTTGVEIAHRLMSQLEINPSDLIEHAYIDLLLARR